MIIHFRLSVVGFHPKVFMCPCNSRRSLGLLVSMSDSLSEVTCIAFPEKVITSRKVLGFSRNRVLFSFLEVHTLYEMLILFFVEKEWLLHEQLLAVW